MREIERAFELFDQGQYEEAEELYLACLSKMTDQKSDSYKAVLNGLGYVKSHRGQFEEAKNYFNEVLKLAIKESDKKGEAMALHQLGMVERMAGEWEKALKFFLDEAGIWKQHFPEFSIGFSANSYERGYIALKQSQYEEAAELFHLALDYALAAKSPVAEGCAYRGLGEIQLAKLRFEQAATYFQHALFAFEEAGDIIAAREIKVFLDQCR